MVLTFGCASVMDREEWMTAFDVFRKMALPVSEHPALQASVTNGRGPPSHSWETAIPSIHYDKEASILSIGVVSFHGTGVQHQLWALYGAL